MRPYKLTLSNINLITVKTGIYEPHKVNFATCGIKKKLPCGPLRQKGCATPEDRYSNVHIDLMKIWRQVVCVWARACLHKDENFGKSNLMVRYMTECIASVISPTSWYYNHRGVRWRLHPLFLLNTHGLC